MSSSKMSPAERCLDAIITAVIGAIEFVVVLLYWSDLHTKIDRSFGTILAPNVMLPVIEIILAFIVLYMLCKAKKYHRIWKW